MIDRFATLTPVLESRLRQHHDLYPMIKVRDYLWEYVLTAALDSQYPDTKPAWDCGSQKIGADIVLRDGTGISCKSGQIHSDGRVKISSSSLSRLRDHEKIKEYLLNSNTEDYIVALSTLKGPMFEREVRYVYSVFDRSVFDYPNMSWEVFGKDGNLRGHTKDGVTVTCTKAMGWQLWYFLPVASAMYSKEIVISHDAPVKKLPVYRQKEVFTGDETFVFPSLAGSAVGSGALRAGQ